MRHLNALKSSAGKDGFDAPTRTDVSPVGPPVMETTIAATTRMRTEKNAHPAMMSASSGAARQASAFQNVGCATRRRIALEAKTSLMRAVEEQPDHAPNPSSAVIRENASLASEFATVLRIAKMDWTSRNARTGIARQDTGSATMDNVSWSISGVIERRIANMPKMRPAVKVRPVAHALRSSSNAATECASI